MKNVSLNIDYNTHPQKLAGMLKGYDLQQGDKLTISTPLGEEMTLLIVIVALFFLYQKKTDYANKVLKDIFDNNSSKAMQDEIAKEYGIDVQVETKGSEEDSWRQFSKEKLAKAYGADEPEYDLGMVLEPNPDYKK